MFWNTQSRRYLSFVSVFNLQLRFCLSLPLALSFPSITLFYVFISFTEPRPCPCILQEGSADGQSVARGPGSPQLLTGSLLVPHEVTFTTVHPRCLGRGRLSALTCPQRTQESPWYCTKCPRERLACPLREQRLATLLLSSVRMRAHIPLECDRKWSITTHPRFSECLLKITYHVCVYPLCVLRAMIWNSLS